MQNLLLIIVFFINNFFKIENIDAVVVPVGGGGLIAGVSLAVKTLRPQIKIIVN